MQEAHVYDLLPGYALGCLDEEDLLLVAGHLPACPECRMELERYASTVGNLALVMPLQTPAESLRAKVLARVGQPAATGAPGAARAAERPDGAGLAAAGWRGVGILQGLRRWFERRPGLALGALAVLLVAVALLGANTLMLGQRVNRLAAQAPAGEMRLVELRGTDQAPQATGYLMVFKDEPYGALVVKDAPALDAAHQYQVWLIQDGQRTNGGVFSVGADGYAVFQVAADRPLTEYQTFGITVEPAGGSPGPTGQKVMGGGL